MLSKKIIKNKPNKKEEIVKKNREELFKEERKKERNKEKGGEKVAEKEEGIIEKK